MSLEEVKADSSDSETEEEAIAREERREQRRIEREAAVKLRRFKPVEHHAEFEGLYKVNGFHPVQFNECFNNRYVVFRKLGWATQSTVWLATDKSTGHYVILKITQAQYSNNQTMEVTFTPDLSLKTHPGRKHLCTKLDSFQFKGPNGIHLVLVFEPAGRSFEEVIDSCLRASGDDAYNPGEYCTRNWSAKTGREACRQLALGLDYLHTQKIMHRDIQPGNIMLALNYDLNTLTKDEIQHDVWDDEEVDGDQNSMSEEAWAEMNLRRQADYMNMIERTDGSALCENDPKYTVAGISLLDKVKFDGADNTKFCIKLIDLGSACKFEDCNDGKTPYPLDIRAPEVILKLPYNEKADIWAMACTIFRIVTLEPLIPLWMTSDVEATDDEHMKCIRERFGKMPENLRREWTRADQHLDGEGNLLEPDEYKQDNYQYGDLWQGVRLAKPKDMGEVEAKLFYDLMKKMLDYDPAKRLSTKGFWNILGSSLKSSRVDLAHEYVLNT